MNTMSTDAQTTKDKGVGASGRITLRGVEKSYAQGGGQTFVLRNITLDIEEGEFVSIMGPSGAGKSTLLHILGMYDTEYDGEYWLLGTPVHSLKKKERADLQRKSVGFVFQSFHLIDDLTVYENLGLPLSYRNVKSKELEAIVCDTLDHFGIVGKKDLYPSQLSGGQQQLVAVARAVIAKPSLILADEPTGNLHSDHSREIMDLFKRLNAEWTTIVQVTHNEELAKYGHRVIRLKDGWLA